MKYYKLLTLMIFASTCMACSSACNKKESTTTGPGSNNNSNVPSTVFKGKVTLNGTVVNDLDFTMPNGTAGQYVVNGSYNTTVDFCQVLCQEPGKWGLTFAAKTGGVKTGTFDVHEASTYYNVEKNAEGFAPTSGTLKITKADLVNPAAKTYYVDGEINMTMKDKKTPANTVVVTGTFSGVNISSN